MKISELSPINELKYNNLGKNMEMGSIYVDALENYELMGTVKGFPVYLESNWKGNPKAVWVIDRKSRVQDKFPIVMSIELGSYYVKRRKLICTMESFVERNYQGIGLGYSVYVFLLKKGFVLASGNSQSVGARKLWAKIVKNPNVFAWVQSPYGNKKYHAFVDDNGEVDSTFGVYSDGDAIEKDETTRYQSIADQYEEEEERLIYYVEHGEITEEDFKRKMKLLDEWMKKEEQKIEQEAEKELKKDKKAYTFRIYAMWQK
jgi:hypothetical protein